MCSYNPTCSRLSWKITANISPFTVLYCSEIILLFFTVLSFNYGCFFLNRSTQVTKSGNCILAGLVKLFLASHWCTIREKKKRRIANASFSGTKCTKDINIIAQNKGCRKHISYYTKVLVKETVGNKLVRK